MTSWATACSPLYHAEGEVSTGALMLGPRDSFYQTVKQPSLAQRGRCLLRLEIIGHFNKWVTSHFNNATITLFTYIALLISYVYSVFYTIYCMLPMTLGHCSSIYLYVYILIPSLYLDLCVLGSCFGIVRLPVDITALSKLEAQAFRYTRNNMC